MNNIIIVGEIKKPLREYYRYNNEIFYYTELESIRASGAVDTLPLIISEIVVGGVAAGDIVEVVGEVRTRNNNGKVEVFIFAQSIAGTLASDTNEVVLSGNICKPPIYRVTPLGREITDIILAVHRLYGTDFIPCIAWGKYAKYSSHFKVGDRVDLRGRFQSREHRKGVSYEVSVITIRGNGGS